MEHSRKSSLAAAEAGAHLAPKRNVAQVRNPHTDVGNLPERNETGADGQPTDAGDLASIAGAAFAELTRSAA
ncbi:hypothetical protein J2S49_001578 [Arcanobacterium wilhelmae]|uniref:Uncharacterized protein n=1 Tax=Arcanobacterium wilhelmae TaxID=1803177 RepID=A0ABT9NCQ6_9ACTO|nr:hypothetical protein [Arcanobacterium wilhelmae]MDP9801502.1 hypothetical protein [Arcanobacterium wilhelmae]WFN90833.1 hypothetical protein P8A24_02960 [Arcanobacterium wilhelmae]